MTFMILIILGVKPLKLGPINWVGIGFIKIPFPNLQKRRELIYLHDLTHIITGYKTTWVGEGEIAAWELASGFSANMWVGYVYPPITFTIGMLITPRKTIQAFKKGWRKKNIYKLNLDKSFIMAKTIKELKELIDFE